MDLEKGGTWQLAARASHSMARRRKRCQVSTLHASAAAIVPSRLQQCALTQTRHAGSIPSIGATRDVVRTAAHGDASFPEVSPHAKLRHPRPFALVHASHSIVRSRRSVIRIPSCARTSSACSARTTSWTREIGRGGMGVVYRAKDRRLKRTVAIKVLPPELAFRSEIKTRFLREAETAAQLNHPNIVDIYAVDEAEGIVFFVMAYVDGRQPRQAAARARRALGRRDAPHPARRRRRARLRPRARRHPPRHQARQHPASTRRAAARW